MESIHKKMETLIEIYSRKKEKNIIQIIDEKYDSYHEKIGRVPEMLLINSEQRKELTGLYSWMVGCVLSDMYEYKGMKIITANIDSPAVCS